jgi:hypothetical protein
MLPGMSWGWLGTPGAVVSRGDWLVQEKKPGEWSKRPIGRHAPKCAADAHALLHNSTSGAARVLSPPDRDGVRHVAMSKKRTRGS